MSVELDRPNVLNIQDALCMGRCTLQKPLISNGYKKI